MQVFQRIAKPFRVALRKESVDRNLRQVRLFGLGLGSLSARRAWIEIARIVFVLPVNGVALRKESVDRNRSLQPQELVCRNVALRKESVDRNVDAIKRVLHQLVALRKESVDRNWPGHFF